MQLDKELIKENFKKSFLSYDENAIVQKETAIDMVELIKGFYFENILEIGSYSGYLTNLLNKNIKFKNYLAIDIVEESECAVKKINDEINFLKVDVENFVTDGKFDLIISNASLQWCNDLEKTVKKLKSYLKPNGKLVVSIFQEGNLYEIKDCFNVSLDYPSGKEIKSIFSKNANIIELNRAISFDNSFDVLRHLKKTGVNSIRKNNLSVSAIKTGLNILEKKYGNKITYMPVIIKD